MQHVLRLERRPCARFAEALAKALGGTRLTLHSVQGFIAREFYDVRGYRCCELTNLCEASHSLERDASGGERDCQQDELKGKPSVGERRALQSPAEVLVGRHVHCKPCPGTLCERKP